jgi:hypothetical protein
MLSIGKIIVILDFCKELFDRRGIYVVDGEKTEVRKLEVRDQRSEDKKSEVKGQKSAVLI